MMAGEAGKLSNQARFILEKCDGTLKVNTTDCNLFRRSLTTAATGGEQEEAVDD